MNYYISEDGTVYAYDDEQVEMGLADDKTAMTPEEVEAHLNPVYVQPLPTVDDVVQITRGEWNALCVAAGAPELCK